MRSGDQWTITLCLGCGRPIPSQDQSIGHRTRMYHNAACKQRYYRTRSYRLVQALGRKSLKADKLIAELDRGILEKEVDLLRYDVSLLQEEHARLEGEVARLTTLLEGQSKKRA